MKRRGADEAPRSRRGRASLSGLVLLIAAGFVFSTLFVPRPSAAAAFQLSAATSDGSALEAITLGATLDLTILLTADVAEPPRAFELVLDWGRERSLFPATQLGALSLLALPSGLDPTASLALGGDCESGLGDPLGRCTIAIEFAAPLPVGTTPIVAASLLYEWLPPDGFEICRTLGSDPTCTIVGNEREWLGLSLVEPGGTSSPVSLIETGTLAGVGLRPIPEPSTAVALGLGLAALAAFRPNVSRR